MRRAILKFAQGDIRFVPVFAKNLRRVAIEICARRYEDLRRATFALYHFLPNLLRLTMHDDIRLPSWLSVPGRPDRSVLRFLRTSMALRRSF